MRRDPIYGIAVQLAQFQQDSRPSPVSQSSSELILEQRNPRLDPFARALRDRSLWRFGPGRRHCALKLETGGIPVRQVGGVRHETIHRRLAERSEEHTSEL